MALFAAPTSPNESPRDLCVVIPAFNEERLIGRCVRSVLAAGVLARDVFVIDDCSSDGTAAIVEAFAGVSLVRNTERCGKARSLQHLLAVQGIADRFQYVALIDADSYVAADYFDIVRRTFEGDREAVLVCGSPRGERHNYLTAFRTFDYALALFVFRRGQDYLKVITVAPGCASTYRASIVAQLDWEGGTLVEDMDLTVQIHRRRLGTVRYAAAAVTFTQDPRTIKGYLGQIRRWYSGTWQVMRLHRLPFGRQRIDAEFALLVGEGLFYSALVLALPLLALAWPAAALRWILLDQAVSAAAAVLVAASLRRVDIVFSFPAFVVLRVLGCAVLLQTFWAEIVRKRTLQTWFTVGRYEAHEKSNHAVVHAPLN
jgi:cellulose synthase/poly-beta-1,6-N-acetylglucosamine synthase-like glycosyltransferase